MTDEPPTSRRAAREAAAARKGRQDRARPQDAPEGGRGVMAAVRRHPTAWMLGVLGVLFMLLGTGAVFAGVAVGSNPVAAEPTPTPTPEPPRPLPEIEPVSSRLRTCSVASLAADARLKTFVGTVIRADTGEVLFDRNGATPTRTASVLKVLTAAAALAVLGPDYRIPTLVYDGSAPGTIVLVGRGDATLSALPPGAESVYRGAPKLADLAAQTIAKYTELHPEEPIVEIVLDASYWSVADKWDSSWKRSEQTNGHHSEVTALQVDGDRADPTRASSPRSTDPVGRAGNAFLAALRDADADGIVAEEVTVISGSAVGGTPLLGEVRSQPLRSLIPYMLQASDNTLAEMLARITSREAALNGSSASLQQAYLSALSTYGVPTTGITIRDGSGLSHLNAVPAAYMAQFMVKVLNGEQNLGIVRDALPVAGKSGTLASRFGGGNADARGHVRAKTGLIDTGHTLSGIIDAADGTKLAFAFYAIGEGIGADAREALDTLTAAVYRCGDNLSNN